MLWAQARAIWLRACLLGLFVCAQTFGLLPALYEHTLNVYETTPVATHQHMPTNRAAPDAVHHHGITDLEDQCCALHSLAGPLPNATRVAQAVAAAAPLPLPEITALTCVTPHRLDRPPKPLPLA
jgi:hypothetical protein